MWKNWNDFWNNIEKLKGALKTRKKQNEKAVVVAKVIAKRRVNFSRNKTLCKILAKD